jgi:hypothetical protein
MDIDLDIVAIENQPECDPQVIQDLADALLQTFDRFCRQKHAEGSKGVMFMDGLLGFHNAYKAVLTDMNQRQGNRLASAIAVSCLMSAFPPTVKMDDVLKAVAVSCQCEKCQARRAAQRAADAGQVNQDSASPQKSNRTVH